MSRFRPRAATAASLVGLGLAAFLTWGHYFDQKLIRTSCPGGHSGGSGFIDCGAVTSSPESVIFHLPVALYGLCYFLVMLGLSLPVAWRSPSALVARGRLALVLVGMGFVLYLVSVEFLEVHHLCLYCTGVHLMQFVLFLLVVTGWYDTGYAANRYEDEGLAEAAPRAARERTLLDA